MLLVCTSSRTRLWICSAVLVLTATRSHNNLSHISIYVQNTVRILCLCVPITYPVLSGPVSFTPVAVLRVIVRLLVHLPGPNVCQTVLKRLSSSLKERGQFLQPYKQVG